MPNENRQNEDRHTNMDFFFRSLPHFDKRTMTLSEWLVKLEHRFSMAKITSDKEKINLCAMYTGQTGEDMLYDLADDTTWAEAKRALTKEIGEGSEEEEAWELLKGLTRGDRDLVDLGARVGKLIKKVFPGNPRPRRGTP